MNERDTLTIGENGHLNIGGVDCEKIVKNFGTPCYVFDVDYIEKICSAFSSSLKENYGEGLISYASKAFSCKRIYKVIKNCGLGTDVVSGGELFTALKSKFSPQNIIFHGNNKTYEELSYALKSKVGLIVLDSIDEINVLNELCEKFSVKQKVLIRVNPGVEAHTHSFIKTATPDSKFGFSIDNNDAYNAIKLCLDKKNLVLKGLHCHIGSQIFEVESFKIAVDKMVEFYKILSDKNIVFDILNLGGGFGVWYSEEDPKLKLNDYKNYIKIISEELLLKIKETGIKKPFLILEPGRSVVGEAGITLYSVGTVKEIKGLKKYIAIDGGMFENPRFALYQAKYTVSSAYNMNAKPTDKYSVVGKCCESGDIIAENVPLPKTKRGDILCVFTTGAYNYSMASNYNRNTIPPVIFVKNGKCNLAVKRQTYKNLISNDL